MNDQRPTRWPCSADSSRNAGPAPRSFRKADTGVSQSSTNVCRTGTRLCSAARRRTSSSDGPRPRPSSAWLRISGGAVMDARRSAPAAGAEHLLGVREREAAAAEQDGEVVEQVGALLGHARVALLAGRARHLLGLLLDLLADTARIGE